ncbi:MAG TPA: hypothetical protein VMP01_14275 [Pirellulaceae bacterium]|nr:hypothetical protein [Pirellulaceae bacterium]
MIRAYLENSVVSSITRRQAPDSELQALDQLQQMQEAGKIVLGTSRQSPREIERAPVQHQTALKEGLHGLDIAADDHRVLGSFTLSDPYGGSICNPIVTDIVDDSLYADLRGAGLEPDDAKHFMYAAENGYDWFVTWDKDFLSRKEAIEKFGSIKIGKPSELVAALSQETMQAKP